MRLTTKQTFGVALALAAALQGGIVSSAVADRVPPALNALATTVPYEHPLYAEDIASATDNSIAGVRVSFPSSQGDDSVKPSGDGSYVKFTKSGEHKVTVAAIDMLGNTTEKTVSINVTDSTPPIVSQMSKSTSLTYEKPIRLEKNADLEESDYNLLKLTVDDASPLDRLAFSGVAERPDGVSEDDCIVEGASLQLRKPGTYKVTVNAVDSFGNESSNDIELTIYDKTPPYFSGISDSYSATIGEDHPDYLDGVSAEDEIDGDISDQIKVDDSAVDYAKAGTYSVKYTVADAAKNAATATASVVVAKAVAKAEVEPAAPSGGSRTVYITATGSKYHNAGCRYLKNSKIPISLEDAKANGYTACKVCGG
ncbi:MAG: DUF5011 domain-containing protein [Eggerthellaceae bacterium]|nr:DUF5011 domain-containing protein [Eggerthellaceae bacterium]